MAWKRSLVTCVIAAVVGGLLGGAAGQPPGSGGVRGGTLVYGHNFEPDTLDPAATFSAWTKSEASCLYDTLVWWGPDKKYYPGLAESWQLSEDGKTYTFRLRRSVKFHDGTPFNAAAVKYTFDRIGVAKTTVGKAAAGLRGSSYEGSAVVDEYTVQVKFRAPFAGFLNAVSDPLLAIVSPAAVEKWGDDYGRHPVGTGPFMFKEWVARDQVVLERNPNYTWGPSFFRQRGPALLDGVVFRYLPEDGTRVASLERGETQVIGRVPELEVGRLKADRRFQVLSADTPMMPESLLLNIKKAPLDSLKVRQAVLYAVDRQTIVDTLFKDVYPVAYGPLAPSNLGYWKGVEQLYPFSPDRARRLLTEVGWRPGPDGFRIDKDAKRLTLDLLFPGPEYRARVFQFVQAQLREVGIEIRIQQLENAAVFEKATAGQNHLSQLQFSFSDPTGLNMMWHSRNDGKGFNWAHVSDKRVDTLLERGDATLDPAKRDAVYQDLQKLIMDEAWILPLYVITSYHAASTKVRDVVVAPTARHMWLHGAYLER